MGILFIYNDGLRLLLLPAEPHLYNLNPTLLPLDPLRHQGELVPRDGLRQEEMIEAAAA